MNAMRHFGLASVLLLSACAGAPATETASDPHGGAFGAYLVARSAQISGDTRMAADAFGAALSVDPGNPELQNRAFLALLLDGRTDAAVEIARRLAALDRSALFPTLALAAADARSGRWADVEAKFRNLPQSGLAQVVQPLGLAWAQAAQGPIQPATDAALATLAPLLASGQRWSGLAALHGALIAERAGRFEEAARQFRTSQAEGGFSLPLAAAVAAFHARGGRPQEVARIVGALSSGSDELALAGQVVGADPERRKVTEPATGFAESLVGIAAAGRAQDEPPLALALARLALEIKPGLPAALLIVADFHETNAQPSLAIEALEAIPPDDPVGPVAILRRALLLDRLDRTAAATTLLDDLARRTGRPEPLARQGDILRNRKRFAEAAVAYDRAIALVPRAEPRHWSLFFSRGIARERSRDWPGAEADFLRALELAPEQPYILNYLAYAWADQGKQLERSRRMIERAVEIRPNDGHIVDSLGWVMFRQGDYKGAVKALERAVELEPRDSTLNDHLGDAYWKAGRETEARFQWRRALTLGPEPEDVAAIEAKLRTGLPAQAALPVATPPAEAPR